MMRLLFLLVPVIFLSSASAAYAKMLSVKAEKVQILSKPDKKSAIKWEYDKGFPLNVTSSQGEWVKVEDFEKDSGWVQKNLLSDQPAVIVKANKNTEEKINIHVGPGKDFKIVGQAFYGVVFKKLEQKNDWVRVQHDSGLTGWMKGSFLWGY
jgi:SH3-like domain-containing protein